jgi:hypothetical protein
VIVATAWLALAALHVPVFVDSAPVVGMVLPVVLSLRGPWARTSGALVVRMACALVPLVVLVWHHPDYPTSEYVWFLRVWSNTPEQTALRKQVLAQAAAWELAGLVLIEVLFLLVAWWVGRRRRPYGPLGPQV